MNVMHLLSSGGIGGIEILCREYAKFSKHNNIFVFLLGHDRTICEQMKKQGSIIYEINYSKSDFYHTFQMLCDLLKKHRIDVIIEHHSSPILYFYIWLLKMKYKSLCSILYVHSNAASICCEKKNISVFRNMVLRQGLLRANRIVAISKSVKDSVIRYFKIDEDKISVIYNGINTKNYLPTNKNEKKTYLKIIYVGRLIKEKGIQNTINRLSYLPKTIKFRFLIVGDGGYREELEDMVKQRGMEKNVFFLGERSDVPELLKKSDIFIHMPICEEGFGITIIEAMAAGLICICNNRGAIPEIISNGKNGFIIDSENEEKLTQLIKDIYFKDIYFNLAEIRKNAIISAGKFSIDNYARELDLLVSTIVTKK